MVRRFVILCGMLALPFAACAQSAEYYLVEKWGPSGGRVQTFSEDGVPKGKQDLSSVAVAGKHRWNRDYDLIEVNGAWVSRADIVGALCGQLAAQQAKLMPVVGNQRPRPSTGYGSGERC